MDIMSLLYITISGITWGTTGIFVNRLLSLRFNTNEISFLRLVFAAIIVSVFLSITNKKLFKINLKQLPVIVLNGLCLFGTSSFYYGAISKTTVSTAVTLMYTAPIIVMAYSVSFLGERLTAKKALAVVLTFIGCGLVTGIIGNLQFTFMGIFYGLMSGISYAGYIITAKINTKNKVNTTTQTAYSFIFATIIAIIFTNPITAVTKLTASVYPLLWAAANGIITTIIPYYFYAKSLKKLTAGTASVMATIEPLSATIISVIFFKEAITIYKSIGIMLILTSVIMLGISANTIKKENIK